VAPGCGMICAGQACGLNAGGGPCTAQYLLEKVDFSQVDLGNGRKIKIGVNSADEGYVLPIFLAKDDSLDGYRSVVSQHLDGFAKVPGCKKLGDEWNGAYGCSSHVRRLNIWSQDAGDVWIDGPGYKVQPSWRKPVAGMDAGKMPFERMHKGYGTPVVLGEEYIINSPRLRIEDSIFELSDPMIAEYFGDAETLTLKINGKHCGLASSDVRAYVGAMGVETGAVMGCIPWESRGSSTRGPPSNPEVSRPPVTTKTTTTTEPPSNVAACAAHEGCRDLAGDCCPTRSGMFLGCCDA